MNTKELRLGNLLDYRGQYVQVSAIFENKIKINNPNRGKNLLKIKCNDINKILITTKIIEEIGFDPRPDEPGGNRWSLHDYNDEQFSIYLKKTVNNINTYRYPHKAGDLHFNYFHELQNLYFSITKYEFFLNDLFKKQTK